MKISETQPRPVSRKWKQEFDKRVFAAIRDRQLSVLALKVLRNDLRENRSQVGTPPKEDKP